MQPTAKGRAAEEARLLETLLESLLETLRERGSRITVPRRAVLDALLASGAHPTAEALASHVQEAHPEVAVSTVYRTLEHFEAVGIISHVHLGHGPAVYHFGAHAHVHLVCTACGHHVALPSKATASVARTIRAATGFAADLAHFSITGLCDACT